jgi:hypothetical protein
MDSRRCQTIGLDGLSDAVTEVGSQEQPDQFKERFSGALTNNLLTENTFLTKTRRSSYGLAAT